MFKLCGYVSRELKTWKLAILNEIHNHKMVSKLEENILVEKLKEDDKKIVRDLTKSLVQ